MCFIVRLDLNMDEKTRSSIAFLSRSCSVQRSLSGKNKTPIFFQPAAQRQTKYLLWTILVRCQPLVDMHTKHVRLLQLLHSWAGSNQLVVRASITYNHIHTCNTVHTYWESMCLREGGGWVGEGEVDFMESTGGVRRNAGID